MTAFKSRFDTYKDCVGNQRGAIVCVTLAVILGACSSPNNIRIPAPVIDHSPNKTDSRESSRESSPRVANPQVSTANLESSNKPGYYTVKPGDTIYHISLDNGQNWKDLARWNNLENPNMIEVGKVLRVLPPESNVSTEGGCCETGWIAKQPNHFNGKFNCCVRLACCPCCCSRSCCKCCQCSLWCTRGFACTNR